MDLRAYYQKLRRIESELKDAAVVVVSLETHPGVRTEVPRPLAAKLIADGKAGVASPEEAAQFRATVEEKWKAAHLTGAVKHGSAERR